MGQAPSSPRDLAGLRGSSLTWSTRLTTAQETATRARSARPAPTAAAIAAPKVGAGKSRAMGRTAASGLTTAATEVVTTAGR